MVSQKEKRDTWTETERKGRDGAVLYEKEDKILIDVENVETAAM